MLVQNHRPRYVRKAGRDTLLRRLSSADAERQCASVNEPWRLSREISLAASDNAPLSAQVRTSHFQRGIIDAASGISAPPSSSSAPLPNAAVDCPITLTTASSRSAR